ncbi:hypothetical protein C817_05668 [Dorea sp. 5-2]|nr:hypothetical protein C817_05668 [Dorea sp. 5-2]
MPCTEAYREHIMYTFNGYCKTVIRFAAINAWRDRSRRRQKEISLEYLTERLDTIMEQMKATEGVTEELKRTSQMEWVQCCNNIHNRAEEIVLHEMIYS